MSCIGRCCTWSRTVSIPRFSTSRCGRWPCFWGRWRPFGSGAGCVRANLALGVLAAYSVGRFWIEAIRADPIIVGEGLRLAMIVSASITTGGMGAFLVRRWLGRMFHVKHLVRRRPRR